MNRHPALVIPMLAILYFAPPGCLNNPAGSGQREHPLAELATASITVKESPFRVWLARTPSETSEGLMHVTEEEIADDQGMLFIFDSERPLSFWMKNTVTPLDIAFARTDGTIVMTHTMPPLTLESFPSFEPALMALEVKAGTFERLGITIGDRIAVPAELLR